MKFEYHFDQLKWVITLKIKYHFEQLKWVITLKFWISILSLFIVWPIVSETEGPLAHLDTSTWWKWRMNICFIFLVDQLLMNLLRYMTTIKIECIYLPSWVIVYTNERALSHEICSLNWSLIRYISKILNT